jgi:hypothetical protein
MRVVDDDGTREEVLERPPAVVDQHRQEAGLSSRPRG